jgi:hypothetical protein
MAVWRILASLVLVLGGAAAARAQSYALKEAPLAGTYYRVKMHLALAGELKVHQADKVGTLKQTADADHEFLERVLDADGGTEARKVARFYLEARADITTDGQSSKRSLRKERRLLVAQCYDEQPLTFCPQGPLTREEMELTQHLDTLHLPGLLPGKDVAAGETWKVGNATAQALCSFDGLTGQDLVCKLEAVKDNVASVSLAGTAGGIDQGAAVKLKISGTYQFDLQAHRLTTLEWKQHDERDQGPASPAAVADLTITVTRTPLKEATELNDLVLVPVPPERTPPEGMTAMWYCDSRGRFELTHAREWVPVARDEDHVVLRLLDRGDFVAQATVTCWQKAPAGEHMGGDDFKEAMAATPGWEQEKLVDAKEVEAAKGSWTYRVEAAGKLNGLSAVQYFYLLAGPQGDQMVATFTLTPNQAQKLGTRDLALLRGITFPDAPREQPQAKAP